MYCFAFNIRPTLSSSGSSVYWACDWIYGDDGSQGNTTGNSAALSPSASTHEIAAAIRDVVVADVYAQTSGLVELDPDIIVLVGLTLV